AGGIVAGIALTAIALAYQPDILAQYWRTLRETPQQYRSPTLGYLLRLALNDNSFAWQFVPMLPGVLLFAWWASVGEERRSDGGNCLPILLLVSMLTAPYGAWPFDLVILLVPVLHVAMRSRSPRLALLSHLAINAVAGACLALEVEYLGFIWMT